MSDTLRDFKVPDFTPEQWAEVNEMARQWEAEQERRKVESRIAKSGIPSGYLAASVTNPGVAAWVGKQTKGLLLQGGVGRGKTYNACGALIESIKNGKTGRFTTFDDLLRECRATYQNRDTEEAVISRHANTGVLVIDDMGKERVTEWSLPIVFAIINKRGMADKPTIITTQYDGRQLIERLTVNGDSETARAIISRLMEYTRVTIEGRDWRRDQQAQ